MKFLQKNYSTKGNTNYKSVKVYNNAGELKAIIMLENANKSGIYLFRNNISKNTYVGSAVDLSKRLKRYYHNSVLNGKRARPIDKALLKYGHSNFTLEILEYCDKDILLERENFYLDLIQPEYNILKNAYSMLGFKHSSDTILKLKSKKLSKEQKQLISLTHKNKIVSEETKKKLSSAIADFRSKNTLSSETLGRLKNSTTKRVGVPVSVLNTQTKEVKLFSSQTDAAKYLNVTRQAIHNGLLRNKPINGIYHISHSK